MLFQNLSDLLASEDYQNFVNEKTGNELYLYDADRKARLDEYATEGSDGSTHAESIEDMRDFVNNVYSDSCSIDDVELKDKHIESIEQEITDCEEWHDKNGSLFDIIG